MVMPTMNPEEMLAEEKETLFVANIEENKARQRQAIAQADNGIAEAQGQIAVHEVRKQKAQKLLDELEARYPSPEE